MILDSELLALTPAEIAGALRHRTQVLAEQGPRLSRDRRGEILRELHQLRQRYLFLRGGVAMASELP